MRVHRHLFALTVLGATFCQHPLLPPVLAQSYVEPITELPSDLVTRPVETMAANMPDMGGATVLRYVPVFAPRSQRVVYWEAVLVSTATGQPMGAITAKASNGKIVEFHTTGDSHDAMMKARLAERPYKLVRFSARYWTAEDAAGNVLVEIGDFPTVMLESNGSGMMASPEFYRDPTNRAKVQAPSMSRDRLYAFPTREAAYAAYAANFDTFFLDVRKAPIPPGGITYLQPPNPDPENPGGSGEPVPGGGTNGGGVNYSNNYTTILGDMKNISYVYQLAPSDPLNQFWHWSGCAGAAHINTMIWHDRNWNPSLLPGPTAAGGKFVYDPVTVAHYLNDLVGATNTWGFLLTGYGATYPWDMDGGFVYSQTHMGAIPDYAEAWGLPVSEGAEQLAFRAIVDYGKPPIIGYWSDVHYAPATKVYTDVFKTENFFYQPAGDRWVAGDDIFYAAVPFDYRSIANGFGRNHSFEHGFTRWQSELGPSSKVTIVNRDTTAPDGTAYLTLSSSAASSNRVWYSSSLASNGVVSRTLELRYRGHGQGGLRVRVRVYQTDGNGAMIMDQPLPMAGQWWNLALPLTTFQPITVEVLLVTAGNDTASVDLDNFRIHTSYQPQIPPKAPCSSKYPDGCDIDP